MVNSFMKSNGLRPTMSDIQKMRYDVLPSSSSSSSSLQFNSQTMHTGA